MPLIARHLLHVSRLFGAAVLLLVIMGVAAGQDVKLSGVFVDGTQVSGNIRDWHQGHDKAKLAERPIFEEKNPIRWLRNEQIELPPAPKAFVEMFGGDRLPAKVIGYEEAGSGPQLPPQLLVQLEFDPFPIPGNWGGSHKSTYKVRTRWVRRIVWQQRKSDQYLPGTVLFRDGRQLAYRSLRFNDQGVSLLTDSGRETANYGDLAEIHFPRQSTWEAWFDQLAALAPAGNARIVQIETAAGMRLTTSLEQLAVVNGGTPFVWAQRVQPAWSLEPLSLRFTQIACERFFALNELPLSVLEPSRVVRRAMLSGNWPPQVDRNLQGQALASGGASFAWGLGVHAYSELAFELPPLVKSFRTRIGLDQNVGRGGCIRGLIYLNDLAGQPRFDSKFIVGSGQTVDTGEIPLDGPKAGQKQLVLVVDPAHQGRPDGADPLDIRDEADWCEPLLTLDADQLRAELQSRLPRVAPGWEGWTLSPGDAAELVWSSKWEPRNPNDQQSPGHNSFTAYPAARFVTWSRRMHLDTANRWLVIYVSRRRVGNNPPLSNIQVRIDGRSVMEFPVPQRAENGETPPVCVPIEKFQGKDVLVELIHFGVDKPAVEFGSAVAVEQLPNLLEVFQDAPLDDAHFSSQGAVTVNGDDAFSGKRSIKATGPAKFTLKFDKLPIRASPALGEYRYLRFSWRRDFGRRFTVDILHDGKATDDPKNPIFRYVVGENAAANRGDRIRRLQDVPLGQWSEATNDLADHFGAIDLDGLTFEVPDGALYLDHVYLARRWEDFEQCPKTIQQTRGGPESDPLVVRIGTRNNEFSTVLDEFAPGFSTAAAGWFGVAILKEFNGRQNVLRTDLLAEGKQCVLRAPVSLPAGKRAKLNLTVAHENSHQWHLEVSGNGESLLQRTIDKDVKDGQWLDLSVDLGKFAGQKLLLELRGKVQGDDRNRLAYWSKIEFVNE